MGFIFRRRAVACVLLMVVLANAQNQPVLRSPLEAAVHSDSSCCSVTRLEARLTSIERRLSDVQRTVDSLNDPLLIEYCTVDLAAYGLDDSPRHGYVRTSAGSSEEIFAPEQAARYRGVTLVELDATKCRTRNRQRFDTYESEEDRAQLLESLESAPGGTIVVGVTADTAELFDNMSFRKSVGSFFTRYNMNLAGLQARDKFAFILQKGYPKKTVFQRKARYGESLKMKIKLSGSTVSDVTFKRV